jgi:uncharacterized damage-inducible protein DinB
MNPFPMLAAYNSWANRRIYAAAGGLSDADYRSERGAFFGTIHATLNHVLVGDRIWLRRMAGDGPTYQQLDLILHDTLADLRSAREAEDARIERWVATLQPAALEGLFSYRTMTSPADVTQPLAPALVHFFNHQTHHRGQVHAMLTAISGRDAAPSLDLILFQRETGIGLAAEAAA